MVIKNEINAILANKLKTILIILSLVFSIISIFLITAISNGVIDMYGSMIKKDGNIIITQKKISDTFFSNVDINLIPEIKKIQGVENVSAIIVGASPVEKLPIVAIYGVTKNKFTEYKKISGNYPNKKEVLVGKSIFDSLENKNEIEIANKKFFISGVFESEIGFENGGVVLNIDEAGQIFNKSASMILINTKIEANTKEIIKDINGLNEDIETKTTEEFVSNYNQFKIIKTSSHAVSLIAFLMGILGIVSLMSITINQRKEEFGIKRAIGIPVVNIIKSIVIESFIIGIISYIIAYICAESILYIIKNIETLQGYVNGVINTELAIYIFITTIIMAIIGAIIPAINASKIDPIILIQGNKI